MGVDGIGKSGLSGVEPASVEEATGVGEAAPAAPAAVEQASRPTPSEALDQLRRGEIDQGAYLDARAAAAVAHLEGRLPADQIEVVRETLRGELENDPVLVELVRRATLGSPTG